MRNYDPFTGLSFTNGLGKRIDKVQGLKNIDRISGNYFAMRKEHLLKIDGFDEQIFLYIENADRS